jgi:uncharacterized protein Usg
MQVLYWMDTNHIKTIQTFGLNSFTLRPHYPPGKKTRNHWTKERVGPEPVWTVRRTEKILALSEIES